MQVFDNESLPKQLVVLGAGATGVEIAQAYGRICSKVTLVDIALLPSFDPDVGKALARAFRIMVGMTGQIARRLAGITPS